MPHDSKKFASQLFKSYISPVLDYCSELWGKPRDTDSHDQSLRALFIAPIIDIELMLNSDRQIFLPWGKFREYCNFHNFLLCLMCK